MERPSGHPVSVVLTVVVMVLLLVVLPVSAVTYVPDFGMDSESHGAFNAGSAATVTIHISAFTAVNGFTGNVAVSQNGGAACSLSATSVTLTATDIDGPVTLTCTFAAAGNYSVAVTGTSGSLSHSATVAFQVVDFTIAASPASVAVNAGSPGTSMITVTAVNGFTGTVTLSQNSGTACSLSGYSVSLTSTTTSGSVTLTCAYAAASNNGVTVTGTKDSLSHSATTMVTVTLPVPAKVPEKPSTILGLEPLIFYGVIGVLAMVIAGLLALLRRRTRPSPTQPASSLAQPA